MDNNKSKYSDEMVEDELLKLKLPPSHYKQRSSIMELLESPSAPGCVLNATQQDFNTDQDISDLVFMISDIPSGVIGEDRYGHSNFATGNDIMVYGNYTFKNRPATPDYQLRE